MEKRSRIMRHQMCYCNRHRTIQVGADGLLVFWLVGIFLIILTSVLAIFSSGPLWTKAVIPIISGPILWGSAYLSYDACKKLMLSWGHSKECSKKIARMACMRQALGGGFKEMEESNNETSTK